MHMKLELEYINTIPAYAQEHFTRALANTFEQELKLPCTAIDHQTLQFASLKHGQHARIWLIKYSTEICRVESCMI